MKKNLNMLRTKGAFKTKHESPTFNTRNTLQSRKFSRSFYIPHFLSTLSGSYNCIKRT